MTFNFNSLKYQLFFSFLSLSFLFLAAFLLSYFYIHQIRKAEDYKDDISDIESTVNSVVHLEMEFLNGVNQNIDYHQNGTSQLLNEISQKYALLDSDISSITNKEFPSDLDFVDELKVLKTNLYNHRNLFIRIIELEKSAGISDYGITGNLNRTVASLEETNEYLTDRELLELRNYEKDFLLRIDDSVVYSFDTSYKRIYDRIAFYNANTAELELLKHYRTFFNELVEIKMLLGSFNGTGLKFSLKQSTEFINDEIANISSQSNLGIEKFKNQIWITYTFTFVIVMILSLVLSYLLAVVKSRPMVLISERINLIMRDLENLEKIDDIELKWASKELTYLVRSFNNLIDGLQSQFEVIDTTNKSLRENYNELKKVNHELDNFVYRVSHDLRAPLASVMGLVNLSKSETKLAGMKDLLEMIDKSVKKLDVFIHEIIDLSRNSRLEIQKDTIDLYGLISDTMESYAYMENASRIKKTIQIKQNGEFISDEQRIRVIISNLISNSIRYINPQQTVPILKIEGHVSNEKAVVSVYDNGKGIDREYIDRIFEMFFRASQESKGSGLGLYIVKETVNRLKGSIKVESERRKFTRFTLEIPNLTTKSVNLNEVIVTENEI